MANTLTQSAFRVRNDNGTEASATWDAALNTNVELDVGAKFRLRFAVLASGSRSFLPTLYYQRNGVGGYSRVNGGSSVVRPVASAFVADGVVAFQRISFGGFVFGAFDSADGQVPDISLLANNYTEVEFCLQLRPEAVVGDYIQFRILDNIAFLNSYLHEPLITLGEESSSSASSVIEGITVDEFRAIGVKNGHNVYANATNLIFYSIGSAKFADGWVLANTDFSKWWQSATPKVVDGTWVAHGLAVGNATIAHT